MRWGTRSALVHRYTKRFWAVSLFTISGRSGCSRGSPPGMDTMGAPHSSAAAAHSSTLRRWFSTEAGWSTLPQPLQRRLHWKSGSSMSTRG